MSPPKTGNRGPDQGFDPARLLSASKEAPCLDTVDMEKLERAFRAWAADSPRKDVSFSRKRILLIFLFIRHMGARLGEVLNLDAARDVSLEDGEVRLGGGDGDAVRKVPMPEALARELKDMQGDIRAAGKEGALLNVDPGHVRRKFYERAKECGFLPECANPNAIRRARAVELLRDGAPLPVVQRLMGQASPNLAASYVELDSQDANAAARHFMDKESRRKTSARNTFFGKVVRVVKGDIQSQVELTTLGGLSLITVITNTSFNRLRLGEGVFCTAEVKAPWVFLSTTGPVRTTAENCLAGKLSRVSRGGLVTECVLVLEDGAELCSVITTESASRLDLKKGRQVWAFFNAFHVVLNAE